MFRTIYENGMTQIGELITKSSTSFGYFMNALPYPFHEQTEEYATNMAPILMSLTLVSVTSFCLLIRSALLFYKARRHLAKDYTSNERNNESVWDDENNTQISFYEHFLKDALMLHALLVIRGVKMEDAEEYVRTHFTCVDDVRRFMVEVRMLHEQYAKNMNNTKTFTKDNIQSENVKNVRRSPRLNQRMTGYVN